MTMTIYMYFCVYITLYIASCTESIDPQQWIGELPSTGHMTRRLAITLASGMSTTEKQTILDIHNLARNDVAGGTFASDLEPGGNLKSATNMNELLWDPALADLATNVARQCDTQHSTVTTADLNANLAKFEVPTTPTQLGENLAFSPVNPPTMTEIEFLTNLWVSEGQYYKYGTVNGDEQCTAPNHLPTTGCGHFTQIIWANTRYVGCGYYNCNGTLQIGTNTYSLNYVCLYYTPGNVDTQTPYLTGTPCTDCDPDRDEQTCSNKIYLCRGGVDSSFNIDGGTVIDDCDNGLGRPLSNACVTTTAAVITTTATPVITTTAATTETPVTTVADTTTTGDVTIAPDARCCQCTTNTAPGKGCAADPVCEAAICEYDSLGWCCPDAGAWDDYCAGFADDYCGGFAEGTDCCACTRGTRGDMTGCPMATHAQCVNDISKIDGFANCASSWAQYCADLAQMHCNVITGVVPETTTAATTVAATTTAVGTTGVETGPCCECTTDKGEVGCAADPECETAICAFTNDECCIDPALPGGYGWDEVCANLALIPCGPTDCCGCTTETPNDLSGCSNIECVNDVANVITGCGSQWSALCAALAQLSCDLTGPIVTTTAAATTMATTSAATTTSADTTSAATTSATTTSAATTTATTTSAATTSAATTSATTTTTAATSAAATSAATTSATTSAAEPEECVDVCDAFKVTVEDVVSDTDSVCITYRVTRLFTDGFCKKSVKYLVLGLCDADIGNVRKGDLNGIIQDFDILSGYRRRGRRLSGYSHSHSDSEEDYRFVWGSDGYGLLTGIRINVGVENELLFELCLEDVFVDTLEFSNNVLFRRGKRIFECQETYLEGLPCIDADKFNAGSYGGSGYNKQYRKIGGGGKRRKKYRYGGSWDDAMNDDEKTDNKSWGALSKLDPNVRWSLVGIFIVFGLLIIIIAGYICIYKKRMKQKKDAIQEAIENNNKNMMDSLPTTGGITNLPSNSYNEGNSLKMGENVKKNEDESIEFENEYYDGQDIDDGLVTEMAQIVNEE